MVENEHNDEFLGQDPEQSQDEQTQVSLQPLFVLEIAGVLYGLPPTSINHIAPTMTPIPVPTAARHFLGIVHLRGRMVTVVDLASILLLSREDSLTNGSQNTSDWSCWNTRRSKSLFRRTVFWGWWISLRTRSANPIVFLKTHTFHCRALSSVIRTPLKVL